MTGITAKSIAKLATQGKGRHRDTGRDGIPGLHLQVGPTGQMSWILRYELDGRERWMGLGSLRTFTLKEARERARKARQAIADGIDPIAQRKIERDARVTEAARTKTFQECAIAYFDKHSVKWRSAKYRRQFFSGLERHTYPAIGKLNVAVIDVPAIMRVLEPIWPTIPESARRLLGQIENILDWAAAGGYRKGANPAAWSGNIEHLLPARTALQKKHHSALPYAEIGEFMVALRAQQGTSARALEFTILTAARTSEVTGATWDEFNLTEKLWTVPENRIKAGKQHRVPLAGAAIELLEGLPTEERNGSVFIGYRRRGISGRAMFGVLERMGRTDITVHGFRSTFRDWCGDVSGFPREVAEAALAHAVGDAVEAAYRRADALAKRRRLMEAWARYCATKPAQTATGGTVVAMRG